MSNLGPDLTGRKIGEYEVVARIGVGGMGAVYEGRQPLIGKRVAVKVLLPALSNEQDLVERFLSEARAVNEIRHRGIVDIFSFGQLPEGAHYFVMEYLEGEAFDRIIKRRAPLPLSEALTWAEEALDALEAAHSAGIIHRDIKPSNLFLVNTGRGRPYVKLLDFGIAKLGALQGEATPQTRASVILGTPDYISPEQARGKPISPQTDLYAMGCVLFEMVTGQRVFRGENTLATMWAHVEDSPPVPSSLRPELPPALDELILWALEKSAASRPPSAEAMRESLAQIRLSLGPGQAMTPSPTTGSGEKVLGGRTPPPSVKNRVLASGTSAPGSGGQRALGTPAPKSGGQASLSGRTRAAPPETKLSPLTVTREERATEPMPPAPPATTVASAPTRVGVEVTDPEVPAFARPSKSKLPLVLAGLVGVLLLGVVALVAIPSPSAAPQAVAEAPSPPVAAPPPVKPPEPVAPEPVKPPEPVKSPEPGTPPEPVTPPQPVAQKDPPPKPEVARPKGPTAQQLQARLKKLEEKLAAREAQTGEKDRVLRQFLDQAKKDIAAASTDGDRREASKFLDEIQRQFGR